MNGAAQVPTLAPKVPTGIPGLDRILSGGLSQRGIHLIQGASGTGKTILVNQVAFHHTAAGGRVTYIGLLSETTSALLRYLQTLRFFEPGVIGERLRYLSGTKELSEGIDPFLELIRLTLHSHGTTLLVIDGLLTIKERTDSPTLRLFLQRLQAFTELVGCTVLFVHADEVGSFHPEHALFDGILELSYRSFGSRAGRMLRVQKLRGSSFLEGSHSFAITGDGLVVHPRLEALNVPPAAVPVAALALRPSGITTLDTMIGGGFPSASVTLAMGAAGTGKTTLGLQFLAAGAARGERVLHFGLYEEPERLVRKAEKVGIPLREHLESGLLQIAVRRPLEVGLDTVAEDLLESVLRHRATGLFIDGLSAFQQLTVFPERLADFFTALTNHLRALHLTTVISAEIPSLFGLRMREPIENISAICENLILLRHVEHRSRTLRLLSILKVREGVYDPTIRELRITARGIELGEALPGAEGLLTGFARTSPPWGTPP